MTCTTFPLSKHYPRCVLRRYAAGSARRERSRGRAEYSRRLFLPDGADDPLLIERLRPPTSALMRRRTHQERMERVLRDAKLPGPDDLFVIEGAHGDPLEVFREGLALARHAGMSWWRAVGPACVTALSVVADEQERKQWLQALSGTLAAWRKAYENRDTGSAL
jgi:hypothetical protein